MKKFFCSVVIVTLVALMSGCSSAKHVPYFQNIDKVDLTQSRGLYDAKIMPKDQLTITVITTDPDAARPFNLNPGGSTSGSSAASSNGSSVQGYLVDNDGNINFPIIGKIHVLGNTKTQCEDKIRDLIKPYMAANENPIVTVRMSSYHVTVMGEVNSPKVVPVTTEKMSILEAITEAGDLTVYGRRDNVMLLREDATGEKHHYRLDLNDANVINSPYFYLQQNDVVYVQPNKTKSTGAGVGPSTTLWFSFVGIVTSVASLVVSLCR